MTINEIRSFTGLSAQKFGDRYGIPLRTIQNWESGVRKAPEYVVNLLERAVVQDFSGKDAHEMPTESEKPSNVTIK